MSDLHTLLSTDNDPCDIVSTRMLDAPRERVFAAFADPARLARWWGPAGFRNSFHEFEFHPAGNWRFIMHGPDGVDYQNHSIFRAIEAPARIVLDHVSAPRFQMTIVLTPEAGRTRITWTQHFESAQVRDNVAKFAVRANEQNFDRLWAEISSAA